MKGCSNFNPFYARMQHAIEGERGGVFVDADGAWRKARVASAESGLINSIFCAAVPAMTGQPERENSAIFASLLKLPVKKRREHGSDFFSE